MENQYFSRWYDKDPVLSMSMRTLANSSDERQIAVALNLIKVIIEHNIQDNQYENVEDIMAAVEDGRIQRGYSRWYDIDTTEKCTPETKKKVALDMAQLVIEKIIQDEDKDELEKEEKQEVTLEFDGKVIDLDLDKILNKEDE